MGLVKLGTAAIDGTKIKANASRHKAMSYEGMQRAVAELKALAGSITELVVAMGREGKRCADVDAQKCLHTAALATKLQTDTRKAAYRKRKWIAETPNGWLKGVLGLRPFSLRGLRRVQAEFKFARPGLNLRRMGALKTI